MSSRVNMQGDRVHKSVATLLALYSGVAIILQNGVNTCLNACAVPNPFATAGVSYTVGFISVVLLFLVEKRQIQGTLATESSAPWYAYYGGPLGAIYVTAAILLAPRLGFCLFQLSVTCGQLLSSTLCDAVGFLHLQVIPVTPWRVLCLLVLIAGTSMTFSSFSSKEAWWKEVLWSLCAMSAGAMFPVQSCVNHVMMQYTASPFGAVAINFAGGAVAVWALTGISLLVWDGPLVLIQKDETEWWMWVGGGVLGATFITSAVVGLPSLGAVAFTAIFISTQLAVATLLDAIGAFGFHVQPVTPKRMCGVVLAMSAAAAFQFTPPTWPWRTTAGAAVSKEEELPLKKQYSTKSLT